MPSREFRLWDEVFSTYSCAEQGWCEGFLSKKVVGVSASCLSLVESCVTGKEKVLENKRNTAASAEPNGR